jgi:hypothetical protein
MEQVMQITTETVRTMDLGHEQMLIFDGGRGERVRVLHGATWLTGEGDRADTFLGPGSEVVLHDGRTLIQGLGPARLQIIERAGRASTRPTDWLRPWWLGLRRHVVRLQFGQAAADPLG